MTSESCDEEERSHNSVKSIALVQKKNPSIKIVTNKNNSA